MKALLHVPAWVRQGAALEYLGTDDVWYPAVISQLTDRGVTIENRSGKKFTVSLGSLLDRKRFRRPQEPNSVWVRISGEVNTAKGGQA